MEYKAPLRDMRFVLHEGFDATGHCELLGNGLDRELIDGVLEEAARYTGGEIAPLNRNSDEEGGTLENGEVRTPQGFVEAYKQYVDNGWASARDWEVRVATAERLIADADDRLARLERAGGGIGA